MYVCVCVSVSVCVCLPVPLLFSCSLSLPLNLCVWISYVSSEEGTLWIFYPVVMPEQRFPMFWPEVVYVFFFSFISWVLALYDSVAAMELGWIWGKMSSSLLSVWQCGSATLASWTGNYTTAVWHSTWYWVYEMLICVFHLCTHR